MLEILALTPLLLLSLILTGLGDIIYKQDEKLEATFSPDTNLFAPYLAANNVLRTKLSFRRMPYTDIPQASHTRYGIAIGNNFKLLRYATKGPNPSGMQYNFGAGMIEQSDYDNALDIIGWDGLIRSELSFTITDSLALRLGVFHISGHISDEYLEKVDRKRWSYARNEVNIAISYNLFHNYRTYFEAGYDYSSNSAAEDDPIRFQTGIEFRSNQTFIINKIGVFSAVDIQSFQEDNWKFNQTYQIGAMVNTNGFARMYRLYLEYYTGRSQLTEFFNHREKHFCMAFAVDM